ncbi:MAG TPA: S-methyl-5-thioribose-1-phosphate isomerase [Solirubrobacteraceae bacterium]|nr:S-methyl-5-thioribose-1-phosphate isomerase [Solirubrobacteraceae bacterium]
MRTIDWVDGTVELIDQTVLPERVDVLRVTSVDELIEAIQRLAVRGAPALGVAGALGVALLAQQEMEPGALRLASAGLRAARPTAVNLAWGVDRALARAVDGPAAVLAEALAVLEEDVAACRAMGRRGANLLTGLVGEQPLRVLTICNTGGLCAVERGTALGVVQTLHERGRLRNALVSETRPLLQGARLTAWELKQMGAPYDLIVDSAGPFLLGRGEIDAVLVGADRIAANGDTANKVGSFSLALGAAHAGVPFIVVAPESTIDPTTPHGDAIEIEDRGSAEVVAFSGRRTTPSGATAINPAFDVTPRHLITAVVTERRVIHVAAGEAVAD